MVDESSWMNIAKVGSSRRGCRVLVLAAALAICAAVADRPADAQGTSENSAPTGQANDPTAAGPTAPATTANPASPTNDPGEGSASESEAPGIRIFQLANEGGIFMYPIYLLSLVAVGVIIERSFALRSRRVMPPALINDLGKLGDSPSGFDPKKAYQSCQAHPSAAANVIRSMLMKVGRPHSEVETTVQQASEREANRLYGNVRWLNLCSTLAPLIGLLGTVQGMIIAFHRTTFMPVGANKSVELANGIYTALVTTFGGLCVAIPAAFAAHYFEGKIQALFLELDEMLFHLLPQIERYEGRVRFQRDADLAAPPVAAPPVTAVGQGVAPPPPPKGTAGPRELSSGNDSARTTPPL